MDIRVAQDENDSKSASLIYAMSWKAGYKGIFTEKLLSDIPIDFWVTTFNNNYNTHRFNIAIMSVNGEDIGAGGYGFSRDYNDLTVGEVTSIYFLENTWGKGYAKELMNFMINELSKKGCTKIHIWVLKENVRAQRFYEKFGFKKTGNEKNITFKGENKIDVEYVILLPTQP